MKVTGWTYWHNFDYEDAVKAGLSYEFVQNCVAEYIKQHGIKFCGGYHQTGDYGAPIIDNKYVFRASFRGWGATMAKALDLPDIDGMAYCDWAWSTPNHETPVYPEVDE